MWQRRRRALDNAEAARPSASQELAPRLPRLPMTTPPPRPPLPTDSKFSTGPLEDALLNWVEKESMAKADPLNQAQQNWEAKGINLNFMQIC